MGFGELNKPNDEELKNSVSYKKRINPMVKIIIGIGVFLLLCFGMPLYNSLHNLYTNEKAYQKSISLINEEKWDEAILVLDPLKNYKYSIDLGRYARAKKAVISDNDYVWGSIWLDNVRHSYNGPFKEDILTFKTECDQKKEAGALAYRISEKAREEQKKESDMAKAKTEGVSIGMTKNQVINSNWGNPKDINKTTTAYGVREQWVYSGYRYLYFENGILTSIQD